MKERADEDYWNIEEIGMFGSEDKIPSASIRSFPNIITYNHYYSINIDLVP